MHYTYKRKILDLDIFRWILLSFPLIFTPLYIVTIITSEDQVGIILFTTLFLIFGVGITLFLMVDFTGRQIATFSNNCLVVTKKYLLFTLSYNQYEISDFSDIRTVRIVVKTKKIQDTYGRMVETDMYGTAYYLIHKYDTNCHIKLLTTCSDFDDALLAKLHNELGLPISDNHIIPKYTSYSDENLDITITPWPASMFSLKKNEASATFTFRMFKALTYFLLPATIILGLLSFTIKPEIAISGAFTIIALYILSRYSNTFSVTNKEIIIETHFLRFNYKETIPLKDITHISLSDLDNPSISNVNLTIHTTNNTYLLPTGNNTLPLLSKVARLSKDEGFWLKRYIEQAQKMSD